MAIDISSLTFGSIKSVSDLMQWDEHFQAITLQGAERSWSFRGQPAEYQTLLPSYPRTLKDASRPAQELIERELIAEFRRHYEVLPDRSAYMPAPEAIAQGADFRCLSVMQHYEVPTRLLDWTSDFWTAVYFACASDPGSHGELWLYDRSIFLQQRLLRPELELLLETGAIDAAEPDLLWKRDLRLLVEFDRKLTPRMRRQFAHHTAATNVAHDHAQLLDNLAKDARKLVDDGWYFRRFTIDKACKANSLKFLKEHRNITASTIFPDVVGLGRFLRWHFDSLRTTFQ